MLYSSFSLFCLSYLDFYVRRREHGMFCLRQGIGSGRCADDGGDNGVSPTQVQRIWALAALGCNV